MEKWAIYSKIKKGMDSPVVSCSEITGHSKWKLNYDSLALLQSSDYKWKQGKAMKVEDQAHY